MKLYIATVRHEMYAMFDVTYICIFANDEQEAFEIARRKKTDVAEIRIEHAVGIDHGAYLMIESHDFVHLPRKYEIDNPIYWLDEDYKIKKQEKFVENMKQQLREAEEELQTMKNKVEE